MGVGGGEGFSRARGHFVKRKNAKPNMVGVYTLNPEILNPEP